MLLIAYPAARSATIQENLADGSIGSFSAPAATHATNGLVEIAAPNRRHATSPSLSTRRSSSLCLLDCLKISETRTKRNSIQSSPIEKGNPSLEVRAQCLAEQPYCR